MASLESLLETGLDCKVRILENDTFIISKCKSDIITETTEVKSDKYTESYKSDKYTESYKSDKYTETTEIKSDKSDKFDKSYRF